MPTEKTFELKLAADNKSAELYVFGTIGDDWNGVSAKTFANQLKGLGDKVDAITLIVNSPGGSAFDGIAMYNLLVAHKAKITAKIVGWAASAASLLVMAADEIRMGSNAFIMIHNSWNVAMGNAKELMKAVDLCKQVDQQLLETYCARTKNESARVTAWLDDETWFNAAEAKQHGFADAIDEPKKMAASAAGIKNEAVKLDAFKFQKVPPAALDVLNHNLFEPEPPPMSSPNSPTVDELAAKAKADADAKAAADAQAKAAFDAAVKKATDDATVQARAAETKRCTDISALCNLAGQPLAAAEWIAKSEATADQVRDALLAKQALTNTAVGGDLSGNPSGIPGGKSPDDKLRAEYEEQKDIYQQLGLSVEDFIAAEKMGSVIVPFAASGKKS